MCDVITAKKWVLECLHSRRIELADFRVGKMNENISQEKLGFRVVPVEKNHVHVFSATPNKKIQNQREPPYKLCLTQACLLCPPPSSSLFMGSFSHESPIVDIHMVETRPGTGVPRSPESKEESEDSQQEVPPARRKRKVARV